MRIISGQYKGRSIEVPKNFKGRPTTDFARESLFNILNHLMDMEGASVLDLFAGTGAVTLECWSRGAEAILAVELSPVHVKAIQKNFEIFDATGAEVIRADVFSFLQKNQEQFDLIFADPPYDLPGLLKLPSLIMQADTLKPNGIFVLEHPDKMDFSTQEGFQQHRRYGNVNFSFFIKK
jgi:16S rRNA (guanine966-N2)-methyltransferase